MKIVYMETIHPRVFTIIDSCKTSAQLLTCLSLVDFFTSIDNRLKVLQAIQLKSGGMYAATLQRCLAVKTARLKLKSLETEIPRLKT